MGIYLNLGKVALNKHHLQCIVFDKIGSDDLKRSKTQILKEAKERLITSGLESFTSSAYWDAVEGKSFDGDGDGCRYIGIKGRHLSDLEAAISHVEDLFGKIP